MPVTISGKMQTSKFDALNEEIVAEARKVYSARTIDHAMNPRNVGEMDDANGYGSALGHCGDSVEIWLKIEDDKVTRAQFWTDGCASTIASGSAATEVVTGQPIFQVQNITQEDVLEALDGLPEEHKHCAMLAADAVKGAIKDYMSGR